MVRRLSPWRTGAQGEFCRSCQQRGKGDLEGKTPKPQSQGQLSSLLTKPSSFLVHGPPLKSSVSQK